VFEESLHIEIDIEALGEHNVSWSRQAATARPISMSQQQADCNC
jgi:hypothetical protein